MNIGDYVTGHYIKDDTIIKVSGEFVGMADHNPTSVWQDVMVKTSDGVRYINEEVLECFPLSSSEIKNIIDEGDISEYQFDKLISYFQEDIPYGTLKARDGDPYNWICEKLTEMFG